MVLRVDPGAHKWAQGGRLKIRLTCIGILSSYFPLLQNVCVWYRVEKQGFSIFSYINFLSATTEEAFIANARPYKFVGQLKYPATQIDKNLSTKYFLKSNGQMCFSLKPIDR